MRSLRALPRAPNYGGHAGDALRVMVYSLYIPLRMRAHLRKWGNSLAIRIPRPFAEEANLHENSAVDVSVRSGKLVIAPVTKEELTLDALVERITPENRHEEIETGDAVGNEIW
jgi:antitoxin MazE